MRILSMYISMVVAASAGAAPLGAESFQRAFVEAKKNAEVVAEVKVVSVVCGEVTKKNDKPRSVTLHVAMQVLEVEKGVVKKNEMIVVSRHQALPDGPGPGSPGYMNALYQFPFTPGVKGSIALNWDKDGRRYVAISGWVKEPNHAEIPTEVGEVLSVESDTGHEEIERCKASSPSQSINLIQALRPH